MSVGLTSWSQKNVLFNSRSESQENVHKHGLSWSGPDSMSPGPRPCVEAKQSQLSGVLSISTASFPAFQTVHPTQVPFVTRDPTVLGEVSNTFRTGQTAEAIKLYPPSLLGPTLREPHWGQKGGCV